MIVRTPARGQLRWLGLSLALLLTEQQVEAEPNSVPFQSKVLSVVVSPPRCEANSFPLSAFLDSLRVELAGRGLHCCALAESSDGVHPANSLLVTIEQIIPCATGGDQVRIAAQGPEGSRVLEREISLADVAPAVRPRALALAVAELIRSLGRDAHDETPEPIPPPANRPLVRPSTRPFLNRAWRDTFSMHVEAEVRTIPTRDTTLWGGRVRFTGHRNSFHADFDVGASYSRVRVEFGDVLLRSASAGLGLGPRFTTQIAVVDLALRAELGWAWIQGTTALADVRTGAGSRAISSAGLQVSFEAPPGMKIGPCLTLESGGVLRAAKGDVNGQTVTGIAGYYLLAAVGVAFSI